jgi:hypothetical protein
MSPCANSDNNAQTCTATPVMVPGVSDAIAIASGADFACALGSGGTVSCWGSSPMGELGSAVPIGTESGPAVAATGASAIAAGGNTACARVSGVAWQCWGANLINLDAKGNPVPAPGGWDPGVDGAIALEVSFEQGCALWADGSVRCFGILPGTGGSGYPSAVSATLVTGLPALSQLATSPIDACGIGADRQVYCWGGDGYGQIGPPGPGSPAIVPSVEGATQVSCSVEFTCALLLDGSVRCWGLNDALSGPAVTTVPFSYACEESTCLAPVAVPGIAGAVQLSVGLAGSCAVISDGSLGCWGLRM